MSIALEKALRLMSQDPFRSISFRITWNAERTLYLEETIPAYDRRLPDNDLELGCAECTVVARGSSKPHQRYGEMIHLTLPLP